MSDQLVYWLYEVADTDAGWQVSRYPDLDHVGVPAVLGAYRTEDAADAAIDADVMRQWCTHEIRGACGADHSRIALEA